MTFLLTDIERSTRLWESALVAMPARGRSAEVRQALAEEQALPLGFDA